MSKLYIIGGLAVAFAIYTAAVFLEGKRIAESAAKAQARQELVDQLSERGKIDDSVAGLPAPDLCRKLGGVWNNGQCE